MPELPDITIYIEALAPRIVGQPLEHARVTSPSLLRPVDPPLSAAEGRPVVGPRRIGKRISWTVEGRIFLAFPPIPPPHSPYPPASTTPPPTHVPPPFHVPT